jgi:threonine/homoserine/homoserine lactone efflux protein
MLVELAWLLGVLTLGLLSPGPDFFLVVKNSLGGSRARAFGTVAGIALGLAAQVLVISLGFAAAPPLLLRVVQVAGALFLAYVGLRALAARGLGSPEPVPGGMAADARGGFVEGLLCNLTNPKAFLFFVSLFAQVLRPETPRVWRFILPVAIVVHGAVAWSLVVLAVQSPPVARRLQRAQRWLPRAFGLALILLAAWVAWQVWRG